MEPCDVECVEEGDSIPVIPNAPECCEGLELIPPTSPDIIGIMGYCTSNCGDGVCDSNIESDYNCYEDCGVNIFCDEDEDCGTDQWIGDPLCVNGDVYQNFKVFSCVNSGTGNSYCDSQIDLILKENCGFLCFNGECVGEC